MQLFCPNFSDLFTPNVEVGKFPDGDSHVRIPNVNDYRDTEVTVFHRLYPNQNDCLVELLLILDTLKEQNCEITVVSPYLPYARGDKKTLDGEIPSAQVVCDLIARAGCKKLVTLDCHFLNSEGEHTHGELLIKNISMNGLLIEYAKKVFGGQEFEVISPDQGAAYLVNAVGGKSMVKTRKAYDGDKIGYRHIETLELDFDVKDKNVLLLDDMISTGNTMIKALEKMRDAGAKQLACAATHGLFLYNCVDQLRKFTEHVFSTDSIISPLAVVSVKEKIYVSPGEQKLF